MSHMLDAPVVPVPIDQEWTPGTLEALPDTHKYEVREGNLVVMNAAMRPFRGRTQNRLVNLLGDLACPETGLNFGSKELRTCDVGVFQQPPGDRAYWPPEAYRLVVEIVSPSSEREDREVKPGLYAAAGIPEFWLVEQAGKDALVHRFELREGTYEPVGEPVLLSELEG